MLRKLARPHSASEAGICKLAPKSRLQVALAELRVALHETEVFSDTVSSMAGSLLELSVVGIDEALRLIKDEPAWKERLMNSKTIVATEEQIERISRECHEAIRAYCDKNNLAPLPPWEDAPGWQKESTKSVVEGRRPRSPQERLEEALLQIRTALHATQAFVDSVSCKAEGRLEIAEEAIAGVLSLTEGLPGWEKVPQSPVKGPLRSGSAPRLSAEGPPESPRRLTLRRNVCQEAEESKQSLDLFWKCSMTPAAPLRMRLCAR